MRKMKNEFTFFDVGDLADDDLELVLSRTYPGNPERGHVPEYIFDMRHPGSSENMGEIRLRVGEVPVYVSHISYSVFPEHRGNHYAARSCRLVARLAKRHSMSELAITCLVNNAASKRTCELAGAEFVGIVKVPDEGVDEYHKKIDQKCKYVLRTDGLA